MAFGSPKLKLDNGEELVMPNIVRTVARCTIINQYLVFCKEDNFSPMSRDNTAADGVDGFEALHKILHELEEVRADNEWCAQTGKMLKEAKLYLKTSYRGHCQESRCPDHCTGFALSVPDDADYRTDCSHDHDFSCCDCKALKEVIREIQFAIAKYRPPR